jgi:hypothetical protein
VVRASSEFVRGLARALAGAELAELVQELVQASVIAAAGDYVVGADYPSCVVPLAPELAVEALKVCLHPDDLRWMADLILETTEGKDGELGG